jgi:hypothetical protein
VVGNKHFRGHVGGSMASKMLVSNLHTAQHKNLETPDFYLHCCENLKSHIKNLCGKATIC